MKTQYYEYLSDTVWHNIQVPATDMVCECVATAARHRIWDFIRDEIGDVVTSTVGQGIHDDVNDVREITGGIQ